MRENIPMFTVSFILQKVTFNLFMTGRRFTSSASRPLWGAGIKMTIALLLLSVAVLFLADRMRDE